MYMNERTKRALIRFGKGLLAVAGPAALAYLIAQLQDPGFTTELPPWAVYLIVPAVPLLLALQKWAGWKGVTALLAALGVAGALLLGGTGSGALAAAAAPGGPPYAPGDVSCTGGGAAPDAADALLILQLNAALARGNDLPCLGVGDVDRDGRVSVIDAELVLQLEAGIIGELP